MRIQGIYAALATKDMQAAEDFYTKLFGRGPDDHPMASLIQWRDVSGANIQVFDDKASAGSGRLTIVVPDMEEARQALVKFNIALKDEVEGDYGRIAQIADPDGNRITLAERPSRPFTK